MVICVTSAVVIDLLYNNHPVEMIVPEGGLMKNERMAKGNEKRQEEKMYFKTYYGDKKYIVSGIYQEQKFEIKHPDPAELLGCLKTLETGSLSIEENGDIFKINYKSQTDSKDKSITLFEGKKEDCEKFNELVKVKAKEELDSLIAFKEALRTEVISINKEKIPVLVSSLLQELDI